MLCQKRHLEGRSSGPFDKQRAGSEESGIDLQGQILRQYPLRRIVMASAALKILSRRAFYFCSENLKPPGVLLLL
jgi:hypothetical protein